MIQITVLIPRNNIAANEFMFANTQDSTKYIPITFTRIQMNQSLNTDTYLMLLLFSVKRL